MPSTPAPAASPAAPVPFKTTLGHDELRHRTLKLAPRQRTMLLLVDGKRTVDEVVALARQAGAPPELFGELVALSLIEVPEVPAGHTAVATDVVIDGVVMQGVMIEADVPPLADRPDAIPAPRPPAVALAPRWPEIVASAPVPLDEAPVDEPAQVESHAIEVVPGAPVRAVAADVDTPAESVAAMLGRIRAAAEPVLAETPIHLDSFDKQLEHIDMPVPDSVQVDLPFGPAAPAPVPAGGVVVPPRADVRVMEASEAAAIPETAPIALGAVAPAASLSAGEEAVLQRVREMLSETLRFNAPLFTARTLIRVRLAPTRRELIQLVWEIEDHLGRSRRARRTDRSDAQTLEAARELLGMGNTRVAGESQPGWSTTEAADDWTPADPHLRRRSTDPRT